MRDADPTLPASRTLVEVRQGRVLLNLSLVSDGLRRWGLPPDALLADLPASMGDVDVVWARVRSGWPVARRLGWTPRRARAAADRFCRRASSRAAHPGASPAELVQTLRETLTEAALATIAVQAALYAPTALLHRWGMLDPRHVHPVPSLLDDLAPLRLVAAERARVRAALERGSVPEHRGFRSLWQAFLNQHGHIGLLDLAEPRAHEQPDVWLRSLPTLQTNAEVAPPPGLLTILTAPVRRAVRRLLTARVAVAGEAFRTMARLRAALQHHAVRLTDEGRLPSPEAIWLLAPDEVARLDAGWTPPNAALTERATEHRRHSTLATAPESHESGRLTGSPIAAGDISGRVWIPSRPSEMPPPSPTGEPLILVVPAWLPALARAAGVVVEAADPLGSGCALLQHLRCPALAGVRAATRRLAPGDRSHLTATADSGYVQPLRAPAAVEAASDG